MSDRNFTHAAFHQYLSEHKLMGVRCAQCGAVHVPPRPMCPNCHSDALAWEELSGKGKLTGFTTVFVGPTAMLEAGYSRENPYCTGVVQLVEGPSISGQILGFDALHPEQIPVGASVKVTFVERGAEENRRTYLAFEKNGTA